MTLNQHKNPKLRHVIARMKSETMGKLKKPGSRLLISSLPGSALRTHVDSLGKPPISTSVLKALPGKLERERSGSVVECLTRDRGAAGSSLTGVTALSP